MEKVKVNKDLFQALENVKQLSTFETVMANKIFGGFNDPYLEALNYLETKELAKLLINGYELEETKEEKLLRLYKKELQYADKYDSDISEGIIDGIRKTLDILDIKIKGINS